MSTQHAPSVCSALLPASWAPCLDSSNTGAASVSRILAWIPGPLPTSRVTYLLPSLAGSFLQAHKYSLTNPSCTPHVQVFLVVPAWIAHPPHTLIWIPGPINFWLVQLQGCCRIHMDTLCTQGWENHIPSPPPPPTPTVTAASARHMGCNLHVLFQRPVQIPALASLMLVHPLPNIWFGNTHST